MKIGQNSRTTPRCQGEIVKVSHDTEGKTRHRERVSARKRALLIMQSEHWKEIRSTSGKFVLLLKLLSEVHPRREMVRFLPLGLCHQPPRSVGDAVRIEKWFSGRAKGWLKFDIPGDKTHTLQYLSIILYFSNSTLFLEAFFPIMVLKLLLNP